MGTYRKKATKRKTYKRKYTAKKKAQHKQVMNRTSVPVGLGFPKRMTMTHRYAETGTLTTGLIGALVTTNYRANALYDPNATGAGHQPMYYDQMVAIYDHYVCIGSKCTVTFAQTPDTAGTRPPVTVGLYINDDTTVTPGINGILENSQVAHRTLTQNAGNAVTITKKFSTKKTWGGSILANVQLQGTSGSDPTEQTIYTLFADSAAVGTQCTVMFKIVIDYICVWRELRDIASS